MAKQTTGSRLKVTWDVEKVVDTFFRTSIPKGITEFYAWAEKEEVPSALRDSCWDAIKKRQEKISVVECIPTDAEFFLDQFGAAFCRLPNDGHKENFPVRSQEFRRVAGAWLLDKNVFGGNKIATLQDIADALAYQSGRKHPLFVRCAEDANGIWLDLTNDAWGAVKITPGKWEVIAEPPPIFRRYPHMMPIVVEPGTQEDYRAYIDLMRLAGPDDRHLTEVALGTDVIPGIPKPIRIPCGQKGAGKSMLCEQERFLVDPSQIPLLSISRDEEQLVQKLMHHYIVPFDNVHELTQAQSDALCRASTGEGFSKRQLYSDDGDVVYKYVRAVYANGLNVPGVMPDFLDRSIIQRLERIPKTERRRRKDLVAKMEALAPKARGYLLSMVADSLLLLDDISDTNLPRMADFAYHGEAISRAMGYPEGQFLEVYARSIAGQVEEAVHGSMLGELLLTFMEKREQWEGTSSELLSELRQLADGQKLNVRDGHFPKAPNSLMRKLNILRTDLAELGISYTQEMGGTRKLSIARKKVDGSGNIAHIAESPNSDVKNSGDMPKDTANTAAHVSPEQGLGRYFTGDKNDTESGIAQENSDVNGRYGRYGDTLQTIHHFGGAP